MWDAWRGPLAEVAEPLVAATGADFAEPLVEDGPAPAPEPCAECAALAEFEAEKGKDKDLALQLEDIDEQKKYRDFEISCQRGSDV